MIKMIQNSEDLLPFMNKYMFSSQNMLNGYKYNFQQVQTTVSIGPAQAHTTVSIGPEQAPAAVGPEQAPAVVQAPAAVVQAPAPIVNNSKPFVPSQKDKLFWCFYIILKGYEEYEMNHSVAFTVEKQFKIETVEKLKLFKDQLKELKLKRTELEDELVNKPTISLKGLCALCIVHNVAITYVYGRKYCDFIASDPATAKKGIILQNEKKQDTIKWIMAENSADNTGDDEYLTTIRKDYWFIENIQKPLNAPSAYDLKELCDICDKLQIETHSMVSADKTKAKTKKQLYEEILTQL